MASGIIVPKKQAEPSVDTKGSKKCDQAPLEHAIMELIAEMDFDGYLLTHFDCKIVEKIPDTDIQTAALIYQGGRYFIRCVEKFFSNLTDDERVAVMKHEIAHFVNHHNTRRNGRDPYLYNLAADMAINQNIPHMPEDCIVLPQGWKAHEAMETYYDKLEDKINKHNKEQKKKGGAGGGAGGKLQLPAQFDTVQDAADNDAGDAESMADEIVRETVKEQLDQGVDMQKLRGLHAGALEQFIEELTKPPMLDWRHALSRFAATMADQHSRRTLKRPDRRGLAPWGKKKEYLPSLVVCVDTSGSVSDALLATFFSQIALLGKMLNEVNVVIADAQVHEHFLFKRGMESKLRESGLGRGGTDFDPAIRYINKNLRDHDGAIYLTDGWCPEPSTRCKIPMIWVVTENMDFPGKPRIKAPDAEGKGRRRRY